MKTEKADKCSKPIVVVVAPAPNPRYASVQAALKESASLLAMLIKADKEK